MQFEFLVMTEKNVFAYNLFLSLRISNFNIFFYVKSATSLKKNISFAVIPSKNWGPVKAPPLFEVSLASFMEEHLDELSYCSIKHLLKT